MNRMLRRGAVALSLLTTLALGQGPADASQSEPRFRSSVDLVSVHVVVRDKDRKFISGLHKEDFRLLDNGKDAPIATLEEFTRGNDSRPSLPGGATLKGDGPTRLIVVLDLVHSTWEDQVLGREALLRTVSATAGSGVPIGLAVLNRTGLQEVHAFFQDPRQLIAQMKRSLGQSYDPAALIAGATPERTATGRPGITTVDRTGQQSGTDSAAQPDTNLSAEVSGGQQDELVEKLLQPSETERRVDAEATIEALRAMPRLFGTAPGRKIMVLATADLNFSWLSFTGTPPKNMPSFQSTENRWQELFGALRELSDRTISIYTVDLRGLAYARRRSPESLIAMNALADETGGRACVGTNDLAHCFTAAVDDASTYYVLGFYVRRNQRKPGWQRLDVRVKTRGAEVLARKRYFWRP